MHIIFQEEVNQVKLPEISKKDNIVPLNYRPVSLTSVVWKLIEKN